MILANDRVFNNIIYGCPYPVITVIQGTIGTGITFQNNLDYLGTYGYTHVNAAVLLLNNRSNVNPQFVNYQADGSGDYHLLASSPCINTGIATAAPATDYDGNPRPNSRGSYTIGAYEFIASATITSQLISKTQMVMVYDRNGRFIDVWRDAPLLAGFK